jgi:hypothetical protein
MAEPFNLLHHQQQQQQQQKQPHQHYQSLNELKDHNDSVSFFSNNLPSNNNVDPDDEDPYVMTTDVACPGCHLPFDKGKKRRLTDACGHNRCYTCVFNSEKCPTCHQGKI